MKSERDFCPWCPAPRLRTLAPSSEEVEAMLGHRSQTTQPVSVEHAARPTGTLGRRAHEARVALWLTPVGLVLAPVVRSSIDGLITEEGTFATWMLGLGTALWLLVALAAPVVALVLSISAARGHEAGAGSTVRWSVGVLLLVIALPVLLILMVTNLNTTW